MMAEQRQLMPPRPESRHQQKAPAQAAVSFELPHSDIDDEELMRKRIQQTFNKTMPVGLGSSKPAASRDGAVRRRSEEARSIKCAERRTKKILAERGRRDQQLYELEDTACHHRRSTLRNEVRNAQGRWPPEARWAGFAPDAIPESWDRKGVLATERGDGRLL